MQEGRVIAPEGCGLLAGQASRGQNGFWTSIALETADGVKVDFGCQASDASRLS
jgi:hypothetical protein